MILLIILCAAIIAALGAGVFMYLKFKHDHDSKVRKGRGQASLGSL